MRRKLLLLSIPALVGAWIASLALAQDSPTSHSHSPTLIDRLDNFGRKLFGGLSPAPTKKQTQSPDPRRTVHQSRTHRTASESSSRRSGSAISRDPRRVSSKPVPVRDVTSPRGAYQQHSGAARSGHATGSPQRIRNQAANSNPAGGPASPQTLRMHQRLQDFGTSVFPQRPSSARTAPTSGRAAGSAAIGDSSAPAAGQATPARAPARRLTNATTNAAAAPRRSETTPRVASPRAVERATPTPAVSRRPTAADPAVDPSPAGRPTLAKAVKAEVNPAVTKQHVAKQHAVGSSAKSRTSNNLLFARQSPILGVETIGPRRITVGKESSYEVTMRNSGQVAAEQVVVTIALPEWAEVNSAEATKGTTAPGPSQAENGGYVWTVGRLEAKAQEKVVLRIVPRQSRAFDLAVRWDYSPAVSQAMIEVQEPKLEIRLDGPTEVLYGESEVYRLELTNSGTGDAENVAISLMPIGTGDNVPAKHNLDKLSAGQKKVMEVELTARQAGTLTIKVDAQGDSGAEAHLVKEVTVYRPALELALEAPAMEYVGGKASYRVRVSNPGTATARDVVLTAAIPPGAKYVSNEGGGQVSADERQVTWKLGRLDVRAERTFEVTCSLAQAGLSQLEIVSTAQGDLTASANATVKVEAVADLALDLSDPAGPVPVGSEAAYQVQVQNRGTKSAEEVEVVVYFSQGIEPVTIEGGRAQTASGQVLFDKIPSLAAGENVTLQIKAKAEKAGNHICRVEVYCKPLGVRLVSEETTHFYGGTPASQPE